ncbi:tail fiber protein of bacteriophage BP-933W [Escherichia coli]|nr:tail fiber protein of bacteriophage BP-933W [Escherichia coli]
MKWAVIQAEQENDMNILKKLMQRLWVAESMMTVNTGSYLQHSCDWAGRHPGVR